MAFQLNTMDFHHLPMEIHGFASLPITRLWRPMAQFSFQWLPMEIQGFKVQSYHGVKYESHGFPWIPLSFHGFLKDIYGNP
jgi:hypothetical protein